MTILADGVNSLLTEQAKLATKPQPHQLAVSVKETISLPAQVISDRFRAADDEGTAWLFAGAATQGHAGGGFLYTNRESISIGLVATLSDLCTSQVPIYQMMEDFKGHPAVAPLLAGGKLVEYSGHLIPEGGFNMVPTLYADGCLATGDAAMLCINLGYQVRGMDYAVASGSLAAEAALEALEAGDVSAAKLAGYQAKLEDSFVLQDLGGLPAASRRSWRAPRASTTAIPPMAGRHHARPVRGGRLARAAGRARARSWRP